MIKRVAIATLFFYACKVSYIIVLYTCNYNLTKLD